METWKRNLLVIWIAQFFSILGFGLGLPFAPFYIQTLGEYSDSEVKFYAGLFMAAAALPMAIMGPIWGILSDRHGRKIMLLRASFCACVIIFAMGLVHDVKLLILLRFFQGALTGTVTAAMTLVVTGSPEKHHGLAMGWISAAIMTGMTSASFVGGFLADAFGYRVPFYIGGALLFTAGTIVALFVEENFTPPEKASIPMDQRLRGAREALGLAAPILVILMLVAFTRMFDRPMFPLLIQHLQGGKLEGAASITGIAEGVAAIAATLSGLCFGRLSDRFSPMKIGRLTALGAGLFMLLIGLAGSLFWVIPLRFCMYFFAGGMDPMFQAWLARTTPEKRRGAVMGLAVSARSGGWLFAPLLSAWIANQWTLKSVFVVGPALFLLLIPAMTILGNRVRATTVEETTEQVAADS